MNRSDKIVLICACVIIILVQLTRSLTWDHIQCSKDPEQSLPEGTAANIGRFPWLGVVQHSFYMGGAVRFAITTAVLVHPMYAIAPAEDMARIMREQLLNNTHFILWYNSTIKYAMPVNDYILHPEYEEKQTLATIALLQLVSRGETAFGENRAAVLPVCLPFSGAVSFNNMFAVKISDENAELQKEVFGMKYVNDTCCNNFYLNNKLTFSKMSPVSALCASAERPMAACVWDGGVALVTRHNWGFWKILGFSVRGPGCGAPTRFLVIHDYLQWIDEVISEPELEEVGDDEYAIGFRRLSPIKIVMYNAKAALPSEMGKCNRKLRGNVLYKDSFEIVMSKDFGQGFFYVIVSQIAQFQCAIVNIVDATSKSNTAIWIEHYCHRELTGIAHGDYKNREYYKKQECFLYFKSAAFVKFRFYFSFKAQIEMSLYGTEELPRIIPNPFMTAQPFTDAWYPTKDLQWHSFVPEHMWYWYM